MKDAKQITGYPDYLVTKNGKVFSTKRGDPIEITGSTTKGYRKVALSINGTATTIAVHRLVAQAFLKPPPRGYNIVNHIDGNKSNNDVSNLEWTNHKGNMKHFSENLSPKYVRKAKDKKREAMDKRLQVVNHAYLVFKDDAQSFQKIFAAAFDL